MVMEECRETQQPSESDRFNLDWNIDFFKSLPSTVLLHLWPFLNPLSIVKLIECNHFFSDNYFLRQKLEKSKSRIDAFKELTSIFKAQATRLLTLKLIVNIFLELIPTLKF